MRKVFFVKFLIKFLSLKFFMVDLQLIYHPTPNRDLYDIYSPIYNYDVSTSDESSYLIDSFIVNNKYDCFRKCSLRNDCLMVSLKSNQQCRHFKVVKYSQTASNSMFLYEKKISNYNSSLVSSLTFYWPFNNGVTDIVSGVTLSGGSATGKSFSNDRMKKDLSALYLNNAYYNLPTGTYLYGDCSVTVWVKLRVITAWSNVLVIGTSSGIGSAYAIWLGFSYSTTAKPFIRACNSYTISTISLDTNKWYHVAYTYKGTTTTIYVNGQLAVQVPSDCAASNVIRNFNNVGAYNNAGIIDYEPNADIDDLKLFNKTLSQSEILTDMNSYY